MATFSILHENPDGTKISTSIEVLPLTHFMTVIQFDPRAKLKNAKIENMAKYGWDGIVKNNYQELASEIRSRLGADRKAKCVVIFAHGLEYDYDYTENEIEHKFISSEVYTNHQQGARTTLSGLNFSSLKRLEEGIPQEEQEAKVKYEKRNQELEAQKRPIDIRLKVYKKTELTNEDIAYLSTHPDSSIVPQKGKLYKFKNEKSYNSHDEFTKQHYLGEDIKTNEADYDDFKDKIKIEKDRINGNFVKQNTKGDMASLKNIIDKIEDGGNLVFAVCHSGRGLGGNTQASHPFLKEVHNHYKANINIFGIEYESAYSKVEGSDGLIDGDVQIKGKGGMLLVSRSEHLLNVAVKVSASGQVSIHDDIKLVKNGIEIL